MAVDGTINPLLNSFSVGHIDLEEFTINGFGYIFPGGVEDGRYDPGDVDCSGALDIDDVVYLVAFIFSGGFEPCDTDGDGIPDC